MYSPPTGGPAFPCDRIGPNSNGEVVSSCGMTLRDYFAIAVLQGWMASDATPKHSFSKIAFEAYAMADEMLKARNKK
jgi:hypothetical protein